MVHKKCDPMRKKLVIGIIMFVVGILLHELAFIFDIWIIRILIRVSGTAIWVIGFSMSIKALDYFGRKKKEKKLCQQSEKENRSIIENDSSSADSATE